MANKPKTRTAKLSSQSETTMITIEPALSYEELSELINYEPVINPVNNVPYNRNNFFFPHVVTYHWPDTVVLGFAQNGTSEFLQGISMEYVVELLHDKLGVEVTPAADCEAPAAS